MNAKKLFITLLVTAFGIITIISCGDAEKPTEARINEQIEPPVPERTGLTTTLPEWAKELMVVWEKGNEPEPEEPEIPELPPEVFPENTYMTLYAPFSGNNYPSISYMDEETLSNTWRKMISREGVKDGKRWFIRDGDNRHSDHRYGNYYYFDKDFDIVYVKQGKGTIKVRKFITGVITKYNRGKHLGTWTIGGLYQTLLTKDEITRENSDHFNFFMRAEHLGDRQKPFEVLVMNIGYSDQYFNEFGVDWYYTTTEYAYDTMFYYIDFHPDQINGRLNQKRSMSYNLSKRNIRFVFNRTYDWQLMSHPDEGWQPFKKSSIQNWYN